LSSPAPQRGSEVKLVIEAERAGEPFLQFRGGEGQLVVCPVSSGSFTIGRSESNQLSVDWDPEVSRFHAELEKRGDQWIVSDQGLSRNGTFVDGERVVGRRRLKDRCLLKFGQTVAIFRSPDEGGSFATTLIGSSTVEVPDLSKTQLAVLNALGRPVIGGGDQIATPATNAEIAEEVFLSVDAVKGHLRILFQKFDVSSLPQNRKRMALVNKAMLAGLIQAD
jgi:hypothetical protein